MGKGRNYELDLVRDINVDADQRFVWPTATDYSGVAEYTFCDVAVIWPTEYDAAIDGAFIEAKKRSGDEGNRVTIMDGSSKEESGLDELERLIDGTPNWGEPYLVIKFDHREVIVLHAEYLHKVLTEGAESFDDVHAIYCKGEEKTHGARLTRSNNISMVKPTLSYWESSTAGEEDHLKVLKEIGVPEHHIEPEFDVNVDTEAVA